MDIVTFETKVIDVIQRTRDIKSFRFAPTKKVDFKAGQFFFVTIKINGEERTKHFSFSNSPTENNFCEFTKRITDSEYSKALDKLKPGDWAKLRMPSGKFTPFRDSDLIESLAPNGSVKSKSKAKGFTDKLHPDVKSGLSLTGFTFEGEYPKIAFLSGGIGITPIRSICKFATDKKLSMDIVLLYGNKSEKDIVFKDDFAQMQEANKNLRIVYTLDNPPEKWRGRSGLINDEMIKGEIQDYKERVFYICGPPKMVESLVDILKVKLNILHDKIKTENFTGY